MTTLRAELQRTGRWSWSISIYSSERKLGPVYFDGCSPSDYTWIGPRRLAAARARQIMRAYRREMSWDDDRFTVDEPKP